MFCVVRMAEALSWAISDADCGMISRIRHTRGRGAIPGASPPSETIARFSLFIRTHRFIARVLGPLIRTPPPHSTEKTRQPRLTYFIESSFLFVKYSVGPIQRT